MPPASIQEVSTPKAHYVLLFVSGLALLVFSVFFYLIQSPNPAQPNPIVTAEYYAMVGGGAALVLGGIADYATNQWGLRLEYLILKGQNKKDEGQKEGKQ